MKTGLPDEQLLHGDNDGEWERSSVDRQWWSKQSLAFPSSPIKRTNLLFPLSSMDDLINEHQQFGITLDNFWMRSVLSPSWETAYFFKWHGRGVPGIVLTVFGNRSLGCVHCLGRGAQPLQNRAQIVATVLQAFA